MSERFWWPGKFLGSKPSLAQQETGTVAGFSIARKDGLIVPFYLHAEDEKREVLAREAAFAFPLAIAGFMVAGPLGVVAGHCLGAGVGYVRHERIYGG